MLNHHTNRKDSTKMNLSHLPGIGAVSRYLKLFTAGLMTLVLDVSMAAAQEGKNEPGGEASLKLPDLSTVSFLGVDGHSILLYGLVICFLGLMFQ